MSGIDSIIVSLGRVESALDEIRSALRASRFPRAIQASYGVLVENPCCLRALLNFAVAVQLCDEPGTLGFSLEDARRALESAARIEAATDDSEHEYARFLHAVTNDSVAALRVVDEAIDRRARHLKQLILFKLDVLRELERSAETAALLNQALRMFPDAEEFRA